MNIQELQTLKHYNLPIKLFVLNNKGYLTWKLYVSNPSGDSLICQAGDDRATGGPRITSGSGPWTDTCTKAGDLYLDSTDRLKLVLNVWNDDSGALLVNHFWDNLRKALIPFFIKPFK